MKRLLFALLLAPAIALSQGGTAKALRADTLLITHIAKKGSDTLSTITRVRQIIHDSLSTYPAGTPDSSIFATRYFTGATYAPITGSTAYLKNADSTGMVKRADTSWLFTDYEGSLKAPLASPVCSGTVYSGGQVRVGVTTGVADSTFEVSGSTWLKSNTRIDGNIKFDGASTLKLFTGDRKSTRLNSSHVSESRMPSSA